MTWYNSYPKQLVHLIGTPIFGFKSINLPLHWSCRGQRKFPQNSTCHSCEALLVKHLVLWRLVVLWESPNSTLVNKTTFVRKKKNNTSFRVTNLGDRFMMRWRLSRESNWVTLLNIVYRWIDEYKRLYIYHIDSIDALLCMYVSTVASLDAAWCP